MSDFLARQLARMSSRISELERRLENSARQGKVAAVDEEKGLARIEVGKDSDGKPHLGPWVRYAQMAGALKIHTPPTVGQTYMQWAPGGDFEQALLVPLGWSKANESPGKTADPAITFGEVRIDVSDDKVTITLPKLLVKAGGCTFQLTDDGLELVGDLKAESDSFAVTGGSLTHNDLNVGSTHRHTGVEPGGGTTAGPL